MRTITAAAIAAALLALTACSSDNEVNVAACKKAMEKQFEDAVLSGKEGSRPPACNGIDAKTLQRLVGEIMEESLNDADDTPLPTPSWP